MIQKFTNRFVVTLRTAVENRSVRIAAISLLACLAMFAQGADPGASIGTSLTNIMSGPLVFGLGLAALVFGGLSITFGGGMMMKTIGGLLVGLFIILDARQIITYIQGL